MGESYGFAVVQSLSHVQFFVTPRTAAYRALLSSTISQSLLKFMSIELVMLINHLIMSPPSPFAFDLSQHQGLFQWVGFSHQVAKALELQLKLQSFQFKVEMGFRSGSDGKESACNAGDLGSIPGLGRSPREGNDNPLHFSCLENSMDTGTWQPQFMGWQRVKQDWACTHTHIYPYNQNHIKVRAFPSLKKISLLYFHSHLP